MHVDITGEIDVTSSGALSDELLDAARTRQRADHRQPRPRLVPRLLGPPRSRDRPRDGRTSPATRHRQPRRPSGAGDDLAARPSATARAGRLALARRDERPSVGWPAAPTPSRRQPHDPPGPADVRDAERDRPRARARRHAPGLARATTAAATTPSRSSAAEHRAAADAAERFFDERLALLNSIAESRAVRPGDVETMAPELAPFATPELGLDDLGFVDEDGPILGPGRPADSTQRPQLRPGRRADGRTVRQRGHLSGGSPTNRSSCSPSRLQDDGGTVSGPLAATVHVDKPPT